MATDSGIQIHGSDGLTDPFRLKRLAEELALRESSNPESAHQSTDDEMIHSLPMYTPLSHSNPYLTAEHFKVEDFLLSRSHTSLADLRAELRDYLSNLKEELVKLINDDYEDFISLSTDLKGEGERLSTLKLPLEYLKSQILESKNELSAIQDAIQEKLEDRATLRGEKALLSLLLKISESVTRLESLLTITSPDEGMEGGGNIPEFRITSPANGIHEISNEEKSRGNRAKHLGRVASEYSQLLYHVSKAQNESCLFVEKIQWVYLDHVFASTLVSLTGGKADARATEMEKAKWMVDLKECLSTYDALGLWRDAEEIIRREVVRGFIKKDSFLSGTSQTIFPGALAAPHSPLVPHTPFPGLNTNHIPVSSLPPRTPYTPFTALHPKQIYTSPTRGGSPYLSLLERNDDPLAQLYSQVLRFVERDLSRIMDISERISSKPPSISRLETEQPEARSAETTSNVEYAGFEIMSNVLWDEIGRAVIDELGHTVFASGRPNEFRKNYEISQAFMRSLEFLAPSLPVYFQIRWKEIVNNLEDSLTPTSMDPKFTKEENSFVTSQGRAVWLAISACWSAQVFIPDLCHRFWRLTLQTQVSPAPNTRSATPTPVAETSGEGTAADDHLLRQCAAAIVDIKALQSNMMTIWHEEISLMLPESNTGMLDVAQTQDALEQSLSQLTELLPSLSTQIVTVIGQRCCDSLLAVRSIPSQFRAMSNKRPPTEPSYFVSSILRPLKYFFAIGTEEGPGILLKSSYLDLYAAQVVESVSHRYIYYLTAMRKTEESLRRLKKGKKSGYSLFGNPQDDEGRDEERIRMQMILDVDAFGKDASALGVHVAQIDSFQQLRSMVHASEDD
ncbi:oligomeric golgi complex component, COG2-domain-containing protein [Infundibulicybe gibba]|nr:oligomeric golgi complex component, COG2-domain-containing protein [Infundibulicybe gibba]